MRRLLESPGARRRCTAVLVGLAGIATSPRAQAQARLELDWEAPPECPQAATVRQKLDALLGEAAAKKGGLRADAHIARVNGRYRLLLTVHDEKGARDRTIDAEACDDLAGAAAVMLGLLLRGQAPNEGGDSSTGTDVTSAAGATEQNPNATGPSAASPSVARAASPTAAGNSESRSETATTPSLPRRWNVLVLAPTVHLDLLRLPKPSLGLGLGVGFRYGEWRVEATGRVFFEQTLWSSLASPDAGADVNRAVVEARACRSVSSGAIELAPCLTLGLDHLSASGAGLDVTPRAAQSSSAVLGAAVLGHVRLASWLGVVATAGVGVETASPRLTLTSLGEVQQVGPVVVSLGLGPEWIF